MSVNIDDDVGDVISCAALFYEKDRIFLSSQGEILGTNSTEGEDIKVRQRNS